jgi:hypothetical protein
MSTSSYRHLTDELGTFRATQKCRRIKRAFESIIRYNEIVDMISDSTSREPFNELAVAMALGGSDAALGYGNAVATVTDDVLECDCGEKGHDVAGELAMGMCLWYLLGPRYMARRQLACLSDAGGEVSKAYAWRPPGTRLRAVARTLLPGNTLHSATWQPLWAEVDALPHDTDGTLWAGELARRAVRRSLTSDARQGIVHKDCEAIAKSILTDCDNLCDRTSLHALSERWRCFFDAILASSGADGVAHHDTTAELRALLGRIWEHTIVGCGPDSMGSADEADIRLFIDVDQVIRRTYLLAPAYGIIVRRAFFGVASSAVELSGLNPYGRLADGISKMCRACN